MRIHIKAQRLAQSATGKQVFHHKATKDSKLGMREWFGTLNTCIVSQIGLRAHCVFVVNPPAMVSLKIAQNRKRRIHELSFAGPASA